MQSQAEQIRTKFAQIAKLQKEIEELYSSLPAESLDADDDIDLVDDIAWMRWGNVCKVHLYAEHDEIVGQMLEDGRWILEA